MIPSNDPFLEKEQYVLDHLTSEAYRRLKFMSVAHRGLYLKVVETLYDYMIYKHVNMIDVDDMRTVIKLVKGEQLKYRQWGRKIA